MLRAKTSEQRKVTDLMNKKNVKIYVKLFRLADASEELWAEKECTQRNLHVAPEK
jgi:hypothetical protein